MDRSHRELLNDIRAIQEVFECCGYDALAAQLQKIEDRVELLVESNSARFTRLMELAPDILKDEDWS